ncbi:MAG TPA: hypothetical protein VMG41_06785 [Gemmatimonadales bacterium]|nr:hypothetical protein [Gemmatimonadales bacterium]
MRPYEALIVVTLLAPGAVRAQESGEFVTVRGTDTVAVEHFQRQTAVLDGSLVRTASAAARERLTYHTVLLPDQSTPLIEVSVWRATDPEDSPARQTARVLFKGDSAAVDDASRWDGVITHVLPTRPAAVPYLNLSVSLMELATRRAAGAGADSLAVPFFNLGGGQTVTGVVQRLGTDSAAVRIGSVEFRFHVDKTGRILGGAVPSQGLAISRTATG